MNRFNTLSPNNHFLNSIFDDKVALAVLIELGKNRRNPFNDLIDSLGIDQDEVIPSLKFLEKEGFIEQNPCNDESKPFEKRVYKLRTKGVIFLQRIKEKFPEFESSFNFFF